MPPSKRLDAMTIDERFGRLTERHEALTMNLELLTGDVQCLTTGARTQDRRTATSAPSHASPKSTTRDSLAWDTHHINFLRQHHPPGRQPRLALQASWKKRMQFSGLPRNAVAVGTTIADRPPHRSVRAELPHTAPA